MSEQAVDRRLVARIESEIRVVDIPRDEPRALERAADPRRHPLHQALEFLRTRGRHGHEPQSAVSLSMIDAVEHEQVKMDIEIERIAEIAR
jgi:hypothetical protein